MGMTWPAALAAAAAYGASLNTLRASLTCMPHIVEGLFTAAFMLITLLAMRNRSFTLTLAAGIVLAVAGSFRPSTTYFLLPAWLVMLWFSRPRIWQWLVHVVVVLAIVLTWQRANENYMTRAGYGGRTFELQAMMPSSDVYATFSSNPPRFDSPRFTYHMPWVAAGSGLDQAAQAGDSEAKSRSGRSRRSAAGTLHALQFCKFSYFFVVSCPIFVVAFVGWMLGALGKAAGQHCLIVTSCSSCWRPSSPRPPCSSPVT